MAYTVNQSIIDQAKREWEEANARGDEEGKKAAHAKAEAERAKAGYSGGSTGDEHIKLPEETLLYKNTSSSSTGSSSSGTTIKPGAASGGSSSSSSSYINPKTGKVSSSSGSSSGSSYINPKTGKVSSSSGSSSGSSSKKVVRPEDVQPVIYPEETKPTVTQQTTQPTTQTAPTTATPTLTYKSALKYGTVSNDVKSLQTALNALGYNLDVDGSYGPATRAAIQDYQKKNGLTVDGIAGPNTFNAINSSLTAQQKKNAGEQLSADLANNSQKPASTPTATPVATGNSQDQAIKDFYDALSSGDRAKAAQIAGGIQSGTYNPTQQSAQPTSSTAGVPTNFDYSTIKNYVAPQNRPSTAYAQEMGMSAADQAEISRLGDEWYYYQSIGDTANMQRVHDEAEAIRAKYNYRGGGSGDNIIADQTIWRANIADDGSISHSKMAGTMTKDAKGNVSYTYNDNGSLQNGDAVAVNGEYRFYDAETGEFVDKKTWEDKYLTPKVQKQANPVYRAVLDENGNIVDYEMVSGYVTYDDKGNPSYYYDDDSPLQHGDAIYDGQDFMYYDATTGTFLDKQTFSDLFMTPKQQTPTAMPTMGRVATDPNAQAGNGSNGDTGNTVNPSDMSQDELLNYLYDTIYNEYTEPEKLEDFLTWAEAQAIAREYTNPALDASIEQTMSDIDKAAIRSGFYGQLPTEALRAQAVQSAEVERSRAINDLALSLMSDSRDASIAKLKANLESGQITFDNILDLIQLAETYGQEGGITGTSGMNAGNPTPTLSVPTLAGLTFNNPTLGTSPNDQDSGTPRTVLNSPTASSAVPSNGSSAGGSNTPTSKTGSGKPRSSGGGNGGGSGNTVPAAQNASLANVDAFNEVINAYNQGGLSAAQKVYNGYYNSLTSDQRSTIDSYLARKRAEEASGAGSNASSTGGNAGSAAPAASKNYALMDVFNDIVREYNQGNIDQAQTIIDQYYDMLSPDQQATIDSYAARKNNQYVPTAQPAAQGSATANTRPTQPTQGYNNGTLTTSQIKQLQRVLGVDQDGMYGPITKSTAGGLTAEEAYRKYVQGQGSTYSLYR